MTRCPKAVLAMPIDLGDRVRLLEIDRPATVTGLMLEWKGWSYRVAFWNNGDRKELWVHDNEIEQVKT